MRISFTLICGDSIQTTSERVQLDQIQVVSGLDISWQLHTGGCDTSTDPAQSEDVQPDCRWETRIFSQNSNTVGGNQFRDTVVDLGVDMVGTSCQDDACLTGFFQV